MSKIVLSLIAAASITVSVAVADGEVAAPAYSPGESWAYEVVEKREEGTFESRSGLQSGTYKIEVLADGLSLNQAFGSVFPSIYEAKPLSGIEWFRFPFKIGDAWPVRWHTKSRGWSHGTVKVVAKEVVEVPAGSLETYKLSLTGAVHVEWEYWYAPMAKAAIRVVQKQFRRDGSVSVFREAKLAAYNVVR